MLTDGAAPWVAPHFHGVCETLRVADIRITLQRPANNRTLEYTNSHWIRAVDRGSYRNPLCSREDATGRGTGQLAGGARGNPAKVGVAEEAEGQRGAR